MVFVEVIQQTANQTIPKSSPKPFKKTVSWWSLNLKLPSLPAMKHSIASKNSIVKRTGRNELKETPNQSESSLMGPKIVLRLLSLEIVLISTFCKKLGVHNYFNKFYFSYKIQLSKFLLFHFVIIFPMFTVFFLSKFIYFIKNSIIYQICVLYYIRNYTPPI